MIKSGSLHQKLGRAYRKPSAIALAFAGEDTIKMGCTEVGCEDNESRDLKKEVVGDDNLEEQRERLCASRQGRQFWPSRRS